MREACRIVAVILKDLAAAVQPGVKTMSTDDPQRLTLFAKEKGEVRASAIQGNQNVCVLNEDILICTLSEDRDLRIDLEIRMNPGCEIQLRLVEGTVILDTDPRCLTVYCKGQGRVIEGVYVRTAKHGKKSRLP